MFAPASSASVIAPALEAGVEGSTRGQVVASFRKDVGHSVSCMTAWLAL
jgi:hypothetical protein